MLFLHLRWGYISRWGLVEFLGSLGMFWKDDLDHWVWPCREVLARGLEVCVGPATPCFLVWPPPP